MVQHPWVFVLLLLAGLLVTLFAHGRNRKGSIARRHKQNRGIFHDH